MRIEVGGAMQLGRDTDIERTFEFFYWGGLSCLFADFQVIIHSSVEIRLQFRDTFSFVRDGVLGTEHFPIEDAIFTAVGNRTTVAFVFHIVFHLRSPSFSKNALICSIWYFFSAFSVAPCGAYKR